MARRVRGGNDGVYFVQNLYLNQTNVCRVKCKFCAFAVTQKADAYTFTPEELVEARYASELTRASRRSTWSAGRARRRVRLLHRDRAAASRGDAGRPSEVLHGERDPSHDEASDGRTRRSCATFVTPGSDRYPVAELRSSPTACVASSLPARSIPTWFHTHRTAHGLGIPTHCTMLYGRRDVRGAGRPSAAAAGAAGRDRRFPALSLAFHPHNTVFERRGWTFTPGSDDLKLIAVSRLLLDNIQHVKAYWIMMGLPLAQVALHFGADDVQGTVVREEIFHAAGAHGDRAEDRGAGARRAGGRPHPRPAGHALQRGATVGLTEFISAVQSSRP